MDDDQSRTESFLSNWEKDGYFLRDSKVILVISIFFLVLISPQGFHDFLLAILSHCVTPSSDIFLFREIGISTNFLYG